MLAWARERAHRPVLPAHDLVAGNHSIRYRTRLVLQHSRRRRQLIEMSPLTGGNATCIILIVGRAVTVICGDRNRLAEEYDACVDRFRLAVGSLKNLLGAEFDRAYEISEKHRVMVEKARLALGRHRAEHRC
jgi:hypothetical protein